MSDDQLGCQADQPDEPADPWLVDRILSGSAGAEWSSLHDLVSAVTAPATPEELVGEQQAVAAFVAAGVLGSVGGTGSADGSRAAARRAARQGARARRAALIPRRLAGNAVVASVAGIVVLGAGGLTAAAYTGVLPDPLQGMAHRAIGAPQPAVPQIWSATPSVPAPSSGTATAATDDPTSAATSRPATTGTTRPASPRATATTQEQIQLCSRLRSHRLPTSAAGYRSLTAAAGDVDLVKYCATPATTRTFKPPETTTTAPTIPTSPTSTATATPTDSPTSATDSQTESPTTSPGLAPKSDSQLTDP